MNATKEIENHMFKFTQKKLSNIKTYLNSFEALAKRGRRICCWTILFYNEITTKRFIDKCTNPGRQETSQKRTRFINTAWFVGLPSIKTDTLLIRSFRMLCDSLWKS